jgi:hypothetical protein
MTGHQFSFDYGNHVEGAGNFTVTITAHRDATLDEMISAFRAYLIACGYSAELVTERLGEE